MCYMLLGEKDNKKEIPKIPTELGNMKVIDFGTWRFKGVMGIKKWSNLMETGNCGQWGLKATQKCL